jgi:hypothetical protein
VAIDQRALEAERGDTALELAHGGARLLHRQMRKSGKAGRVFGDLGSEKIVGPLGCAHGLRGVALDLHTGRDQREN